jgi:hypothetical protein
MGRNAGCTLRAPAGVFIPQSEFHNRSLGERLSCLVPLAGIALPARDGNRRDFQTGDGGGFSPRNFI